MGNEKGRVPAPPHVFYGGDSVVFKVNAFDGPMRFYVPRAAYDESLGTKARFICGFAERNQLSRAEVIDLLRRHGIPTVGEHILLNIRHHLTTGDDARPSQRPPRHAEFILELVSPAVYREALIGDMYENYGKWVKKYGRVGAGILAYAEATRSFWPLLWWLVTSGAWQWLRRQI